jgi:arsenic resistance protein ArsH
MTTAHLRCRSFSKLMAFEAARILDRIGCEVRVYDPMGLPVKDDVQHDHPKVQELRNLSIWSEAQFWCSPEQHGNITAVMKNQIDWIPLSTGSVRPTQGRILGFAQVSALWYTSAPPDTIPILGEWRQSVIQHCQHIAHSRTLDAHVCHSQSGRRPGPVGSSYHSPISRSHPYPSPGRASRRQASSNRPATEIDWSTYAKNSSKSP